MLKYLEKLEMTNASSANSSTLRGSLAVGEAEIDLVDDEVAAALRHRRGDPAHLVVRHDGAGRDSTATRSARRASCGVQFASIRSAVSW